MTENQKSEIMRLRAAGNGYGKIAKLTNISLNTIKSFCRRNEPAISETISAETLSGEVSNCANCGKEIKQIAKRKRKRFCCDKCRNEWWNSHLDQVNRQKIYTFKCPYCGKEFHIYGDSRRKYCCHACYVSDRFGGGRRG